MYQVYQVEVMQNLPLSLFRFNSCIVRTTFISGLNENSCSYTAMTVKI